MIAPGARALAFSSRWFDPATVDHTFEPLIADWQREWIDAPPARRRLVYVRGVLSFYIAAMLSMPSIVRVRAPKSLIDQVARRVLSTTAIGTTVLVLPFVREIELGWRQFQMLLLLIPQAVTLAFPFAMIAAVDAIRRAKDVAPHVSRATTAKLAVFAVVFVALNHGWVVPAANQAWRETMSHASLTRVPNETRSFKPAKGLRELTTYELVAAPELATVNEPGTYAFSRAHSIRVEMNNRATLAVLPVFLLWRRWRALDLPDGRWFSPRHPVVATLIGVAAFFSLRGFFNAVEHAWSLPAGSGAWVQLGFLAMLGMARVWLVEQSVARMNRISSIV